MYRGSRTFHRWLGLGASIFLVLIAITGFFLANKDRFGWLRPPPAKAQEIQSAGEVISIQQAVEAAFALGHPELQRFDQIDRVDYRPGKNIFKVISNDDYREVQVDGKTGKVLSSSFRYDQLTEDFHDMSFFSDVAKLWLLPSWP